MVHIQLYYMNNDLTSFEDRFYRQQKNALARGRFFVVTSYGSQQVVSFTTSDIRP